MKNMDINIKTLDNVEVFQLAGNLVYEDLGPLRNLRERIVDSDMEHFLLDLSGVTFIDSSGVGSIIGMYRSAIVKNADFALIKPTGVVLQSLKFLGVTNLMRIYQSEQEAIEGA